MACLMDEARERCECKECTAWRRQRFEEALSRAQEIVATWPEWKRNVLGDSLNPTVPVPRTPIIYGD